MAHTQRGLPYAGRAPVDGAHAVHARLHGAPITRAAGRGALQRRKQQLQRALRAQDACQ